MICSSCGHQNRDGHHYCTQCGVRLDNMPKHRGCLVIISEPDNSPQQRRRSSGPKPEEERRGGIEIKQPSFLIGREEDNTFIVDNDQASAYHAKITSDGQQFWIEDLGSTNGTYIDGIRIYTLYQLRPGCLIKIGSSIVKFRYIPTDEAE